MTIPLFLCLLLPLVLLIQALDAQSSSEPGRLGKWLRSWPSDELATRLIVAGAVLATLAVALAVMVHESPLLFDDSFISYRYAKNLGMGDGLRWNPGETPSEGYTNFLLVIVLAPLIRFGVDPLLATRVLSTIGSLVMVALVYDTMRREVRVAWPAAALTALGILTMSSTVEVSMVGLETMLFAATLFAAYYLSQRYFATERMGFLYASGATCFAASLLRPEAVFLPIAIGVSSLLLDAQRPGARWLIFRGLALSFVLPVLLNLGWKLYYFGSILPNPAFLKVPGGGLVRPRGVLSVGHFVYGHAKVILFAVLGLPFVRADKRGQLTCSLVLAAYLSFYLRVDTLMDTHGRFLYPAFPFLFMIAVAPIGTFIERFLAWRMLPSLRVAMGGLMFLAFFY